jgi:hypothetical protein
MAVEFSALRVVHLLIRILYFISVVLFFKHLTVVLLFFAVITFIFNLSFKPIFKYSYLKQFVYSNFYLSYLSIFWFLQYFFFGKNIYLNIIERSANFTISFQGIAIPWLKKYKFLTTNYFFVISLAFCFLYIYFGLLDNKIENLFLSILMILVSIFFYKLNLYLNLATNKKIKIQFFKRSVTNSK